MAAHLSLWHEFWLMINRINIKEEVMKNLLKLFTILLSGSVLLLSASSCSGPSTVVTGTWEKPGVEQQYDDIMVAALITTVSSRSVIEQNIVEELEDEGVNARQSIDVLPPRFIEKNDKKQQIVDNIRTDGSDAILTVALIEKDTESRYVPGAGVYAPYPTYGYYGSFWGYYDYWYPRFYNTGYYNEYKVFYMETNLYDAQSEDLIWSAQSETVDWGGVVNFSDEFAEEIVEQLDEQGLID